jgi:hypothetical protein
MPLHTTITASISRQGFGTGFALFDLGRDQSFRAFSALFLALREFRKHVLGS